MKKLVAQAGDEAYSLQYYFAANAIQNIYLNHKRRKERDAGIRPTVSAAPRPEHNTQSLRETLKFGSRDAVKRSASATKSSVLGRSAFVKSIRRGIGLQSRIVPESTASDSSGDEHDEVAIQQPITLAETADRRSSKVAPALSPIHSRRP